MGEQMVVTNAIITVLLAFFTWYAWFMSARGVLR